MALLPCLTLKKATLCRSNAGGGNETKKQRHGKCTRKSPDVASGIIVVISRFGFTTTGQKKAIAELQEKKCHARSTVSVPPANSNTQPVVFVKKKPRSLFEDFLINSMFVMLFYASSQQFTLQKRKHISWTLIIKPGAFALQSLICIRVENCRNSLLHIQLWLLLHQQQCKVFHHAQFHLFSLAHILFRSFTAFSVPKKYCMVKPFI